MHIYISEYAIIGYIMSWRMFGTKSLSESMIAYCQLDHWKYISLNFDSKYKSFPYKKMNLTISTKWWPFCVEKPAQYLKTHPLRFRYCENFVFVGHSVGNHDGYLWGLWPRPTSNSEELTSCHPKTTWGISPLVFVRNLTNGISKVL